MTKKTLHRIRLFMTFGLLMAYTALIVALTATSINSDFAIPAFVIWLIATPLLTSFLGVVWRYKLILAEEMQDISEAKDKDAIEKRKRDRIDSVLRDLSNEDLIRLRERLMDGTIDDELLQQEIVGDDGELMYMEKNS